MITVWNFWGSSDLGGDALGEIALEAVAHPPGESVADNLGELGAGAATAAPPVPLAPCCQNASLLTKSADTARDANGDVLGNPIRDLLLEAERR